MNRGMMQKINQHIWKEKARIREIQTFSFSGGVSEFLLEKRGLLRYKTLAKCYIYGDLLEVFSVDHVIETIKLVDFIEEEGFRVLMRTPIWWKRLKTSGGTQA